MQLDWKYGDPVNEMAEDHLDTTPASVHIHMQLPLFTFTHT